MSSAPARPHAASSAWYQVAICAAGCVKTGSPADWIKTLRGNVPMPEVTETRADSGAIATVGVGEPVDEMSTNVRTFYATTGECEGIATVLSSITDDIRAINVDNARGVHVLCQSCSSGSQLSPQ